MQLPFLETLLQMCVSVCVYTDVCVCVCIWIFNTGDNIRRHCRCVELRLMVIDSRAPPSELIHFALFLCDTNAFVLFLSLLLLLLPADLLEGSQGGIRSHYNPKGRPIHHPYSLREYGNNSQRTDRPTRLEIDHMLSDRFLIRVPVNVFSHRTMNMPPLMTFWVSE